MAEATSAGKELGAQLRRHIVEEIKRGQDALELAQKTLDLGYPYDAASRAYFGAFHLARALCWVAGEEPNTHAAVAHLLNIHYVQPRKLPSDTDRLYRSLERFREQADYDIRFQLDLRGGSDLVRDARRLVDSMAALLKTLGALDAPV